MMYKVPVIGINPVYDVDNTIFGTEYLDGTLYVSKSDDYVQSFMSAVNDLVNSDSSIILYRQDVRAFADKIGGKEVFKQIKVALRDRYTVLKLRYNPRTQEYCGVKTAFIIHQR